MNYQDYTFHGYAFDYVCPPIPIRSFDWCAHDINRNMRPTITLVDYHGSTPESLMQQILEDFWDNFLGIEWKYYRPDNYA